MCVYGYFPTCCSLQVCTIVHTLMPVSLQKQKIHSLPLSLLSFSFFSIKVTPRASLSGPSYCLVINSCSKPVLAPCDTTANIGITFLITCLSLKCHRGGQVCLQLAYTASVWRYHLSLIKAKWKSRNVVWVGGVVLGCGGIAVSSFPAVLICHSNEQAAVHGHQAIIFGYHANSEHHGMSLCWEIYPGSITIVGEKQMLDII